MLLVSEISSMAGQIVSTKIGSEIVSRWISMRKDRAARERLTSECECFEQAGCCVAEAMLFVLFPAQIIQIKQGFRLLQEQQLLLLNFSCYRVAIVDQD